MLRVTILVVLVLVGCSQTASDSTLNSNQVAELEAITSPSGNDASLPYLVTGEDDYLYMSWVEKKDSGWVHFLYSRLEDQNWSSPELIAKGNDWFVNWADYPMIAVDQTGNMVAHFLAKSSSGTYSYDVNVLYKPIGAEWSDPIIPHDDGTPTEHGFVTLLPQNDGTFRLAWLDGRNTGGGEHDGGHGGGGAMTVRTAVLNMEGKLSEEAELDNRVCDCCQTTGAVTSAGPIYFYRDRSELEIRDIGSVRAMQDGWSAPATVWNDNWKIPGCPVNGPRAAAIDNAVALAWFTAALSQPKVKLAFSDDGGMTFKKPIVLDQTNTIGRVDVDLISAREAVATWLSTADGKTTILGRRASMDGNKSATFTIAETSESRGSGFPQLAIHEGTTYFAWTRLDESTSTIQMKKLSTSP